MKKKSTKSTTERAARGGDSLAASPVPEKKLGKKIGYARVSSKAQDHALQETALRAAGCADIFFDKISTAMGAADDRPGFGRALEALAEGDTLVLWRFDRLCRKPEEGLRLLDELLERGVRIESVTENIELRGAFGRMAITLIWTWAAWERASIIERTSAGRERARKAGKSLGGRNFLFDDKKRRAAALLLSDENTKVPAAAEQLRVGSSTLYREIEKFNAAALETGKPARELFVAAWGEGHPAPAPLLDFIARENPA